MIMDMATRTRIEADARLSLNNFYLDGASTIKDAKDRATEKTAII